MEKNLPEPRLPPQLEQERNERNPEQQLQTQGGIGRKRYTKQKTGKDGWRITIHTEVSLTMQVHDFPVGVVKNRMENSKNPDRILVPEPPPMIWRKRKIVKGQRGIFSFNY